MEENISRPIKDPSVEGVEGLSGVNTSPSSNNKDLLDKLPKFSAAQARQTTDGHYKVYEVPGYGDSKHDKKISSFTELMDLENTRAQYQSGFNKIASSVGKGLVLAGTTFVNGVAGLPVGLINWAATGSFSEGFINNPITELTQEINKWSEDLLPVYRTAEQRTNDENGEWYKNVFSAYFIGDKFLKNLGFAVGAYYSGMVWSKLTNSVLNMASARAALKGSAILGAEQSSFVPKAVQINNAFKSGNIKLSTEALVKSAQAANKTLKYKNLALQATGVLTSAIGEANIEAYSGSHDYMDQKFAALEEAKNMLVQEKTNEYKLLTGNNNLDEQTLQSIENSAKLELNYDDMIQKIGEEGASMANRIFLYNLVVLSISNAAEFGRMYSGGYKTARKAFNKKINVNEKGLFEFTKPSKLKKVVGGTVAMGISEGPFEEMQQATATKWAENIAQKNLESYAAKKYDPDYEEEQVSTINELWNAAKEVYGSSKGWEEGFIGALTGMMGIPGYNKSAKWGQGRILQGGISSQIQEYNESRDYSNALVESINKSIQRPNRRKEWVAGIARSSINHKQMQALEIDDKFEYKNAEHQGLINEVLLYKELGRIQELYDYIDGISALDPNNSEQIDDIRQMFVNEETGESLFQTETNEQIVNTLKENVEETKKSIEHIIEISDGLQAKAGGQLSTEVIDELIWMMAQADNLESRFIKLWNNNKANLESIREGLQYIREKTPNETNKEDNLDKSINALNSVLHMNPSLLLETSEMKIKDTDLFSLSEGLKNVLQVTNVKNEDEVLSTLSDLTKMIKTRQNFLSQYKQAIENPTSLQEKIDKVKKESAKVTTNKQIKKGVNRLNKAKSLANFREILTTFDENTDIDELVRIADEEENNTFAKEYRKINTFKENLNSIANNVTPKDLEGLKKEEDRKSIIAHAKELYSKLFDTTNKLDDVLKIDSPFFQETLNNLKKESPEYSDSYWYTLENLMSKWFVTAARNIEENNSKALDQTPITDKSDELADEIKTQEVIPDGSIPLTIHTPFEEVARENRNSVKIDVTESLEEKNKEPVQIEGESSPVLMHTSMAPTMKQFVSDEINQRDKGGNIETSNLIPTQEHKKWASFARIMDFLHKVGAFKYFSSEGKFKETTNESAGTKIYFIVDPNYKNEYLKGELPLFFAVKDDEGNTHIIGDAPLSSSNKNIYGLEELRRDINKEWTRKKQEALDEGKDISSEPYEYSKTSSINQLMHGVIPLGPENDIRNLNEVLNMVNGDWSDYWGNPIYFGILDHGVMRSNLPKNEKDSVILPAGALNKTGALYLFLRGIDGRYYPVRMTTQYFTEDNFNNLNKNSITYKRLDAAVDGLIDAAIRGDEEARSKKVNELSNIVYMGHILVSFDKYGSMYYISMNNKTNTKIHPRIKLATISKNEKGEEILDFEDREKIKEQFFKDLALLNPPFQIDLDLIESNDTKKSRKYINSIITDGLLSSNLIAPVIANNWFTVHGYDPKTGDFRIGKKWRTREEFNVLNPRLDLSYNGENYMIDENNGVFIIKSDGDKKGIEKILPTDKKFKIIKAVYAARQWKKANNSEHYYKDDNFEITKHTNIIDGIEIVYFYDFKTDKFVNQGNKNYETFDNLFKEKTIKQSESSDNTNTERKVYGIKPTDPDKISKLEQREITINNGKQKIIANTITIPNTFLQKYNLKPLIGFIQPRNSNVKNDPLNYKIIFFDKENTSRPLFSILFRGTDDNKIISPLTGEDYILTMPEFNNISEDIINSARDIQKELHKSKPVDSKKVNTLIENLEKDTGNRNIIIANPKMNIISQVDKGKNSMNINGVEYNKQELLSLSWSNLPQEIKTYLNSSNNLFYEANLQSSWDNNLSAEFREKMLEC